MLSLSKRRPRRQEAWPARRCPRGSAGPGERRRGLSLSKRRPRRPEAWPGRRCPGHTASGIVAMETTLLHVHNMYRNTAKPSIELKPREVLILGMMPYDRSAQVLPRLLPGCAAIARAWPCPQLPRCRRSLLIVARPPACSVYPGSLAQSWKTRPNT